MSEMEKQKEKEKAARESLILYTLFSLILVGLAYGLINDSILLLVLTFLYAGIVFFIYMIRVAIFSNEYKKKLEQEEAERLAAEAEAAALAEMENMEGELIIDDAESMDFENEEVTFDGDVINIV